MIDIEHNGHDRFREQFGQKRLRFQEELVAPEQCDPREIPRFSLRRRLDILVPMGRQHPPLGQQYLVHTVNQGVHRLIHPGFPDGSDGHQQIMLPQQHLDPQQLFLKHRFAFLLRHHQQLAHRRTEHLLFPEHLGQDLRRAQHRLLYFQVRLLAFPVSPADHIAVQDAEAPVHINMVQMFLQGQTVAHPGQGILITDGHQAPHQMLAVHHGRKHVPQARHQKISVRKGVVVGIFQHKKAEGLAMERQHRHHGPVNVLFHKHLVHFRIILL